jgi:flagellar M-ring protein FliF
LNTAAPASTPVDARLAPWLERLRALPRLPLMLGGALLVAVIVAAALWSRAPEYRVLFTNMGERDGGAIVSALTQMNVPYRFAEGGGALLVPADKVYETRLQLASQGLPRGGSTGFELLDNTKFGASQFTEQINYQRALEGELARSIESVQAVEKARVHLALPRQSLFVRERQAPSASVVLTLYPGRSLSEAQVAAIAHLVSSSVPNLDPANISLVDQRGRLLSSPGAEGRGLDASQFNYVRDLEQTYVQRIQAILTPLLGPGNAHAQVSAEVDFSRQEQTSESWRPNQEPGQASIRSQQTSESSQSGGLPAQGVPGALTNQPPADTTAPLVNPPAPPVAGQPPAPAAAGTVNGATVPAQPAGNARREATTNYELDRTVNHIKRAVGTVQRLSVAVVVNYRPDDEGVAVPLPPEELDQLRNLVREAMGYSADRGDTLNVVNGRFAVDADADAIVWWKDPHFIDLIKTVGGWVLLVIGVLWLWLAILRPLIRGRPPTVEEAARAAASAQAAAESSLSEEEMAAKREARERDRNRYESNLETARELANKDPRAVAWIIRSWIEKDGQ